MNKICQIYHRILQVVYDDFDKPYDEQNKDVSIH